MFHQNPQAQIALRFATSLAFSKTFTNFHLPIDHNVQLQYIVSIFIFLILKFQKLLEATFMLTVTGNRYKKWLKKNHKFRRSSDVKIAFSKKSQVQQMTPKMTLNITKSGYCNIC